MIDTLMTGLLFAVGFGVLYFFAPLLPSTTKVPDISYNPFDVFDL